MHTSPDSPRATRTVAITPVPGAQGRTVLLIEDDEEHRFVYERLLTAGGYAVVEAKTGPGGLETAQRVRPDVIILDIGLPGVDGWEVTRRLKAAAETREVPVIAVTVHTFAGDRERSLAAGCVMHLDKPAAPSEVLAAVDEVLGVERRPQAKP